MIRKNFTLISGTFARGCIWVTLSLYLAFIGQMSCTRGNDYEKSFDLLNLRFSVHRNDSTLLINFGNSISTGLMNHVEVYRNTDLDVNLFDIIIDNTTGLMKVERLIFYPKHYYTFIVPDYDHIVYQYTSFDSDHVQLHELSLDMKQKFTLINDSGMDVIKHSDLPKNMLYANIQIAPYGKSVCCRLYDLGQKDSINAYISALVSTSHVSYFKELSKSDINIDYSINCNRYKLLKENDYTITPFNKRNYMAYRHWLFLDTMKTDGALKLREVVWEDDSYNMTIFYKINSKGELIPVNGARYKKYIQQSNHLYYE